MMLRGGLLAGAEVALIILVHAVGDGVESAGGAEIFHDGEELVFAMEAALAVIAGIFGAVEFCGRDDFEGNPMFVGEGDGVGEMGAGQAGGVGDYCEHIGAEFAVRGPGEVSGVYSSGVGDEDATQVAQGGAKLSFLARERGVWLGHSNMVTAGDYAR